ncbi:response regulator transcription factor [Tissierella carlieri]|jgi:two-component system OmpR family response regulator|uniref:response regulator transcription factor n=1 Tax=Tissierella TaxID=41273 RepID=UPI00280654C7|nr:response regulator transcription factor [uncultured Tissierella sp.]MDU5081650.1 response regulator transcription factor [Bacillota bacterium]
MTNILLVDDNEKIRKLIEIYLKKEGFQVFHGENGEEALDILDNVKIDLIIADIMMPKMDGYELVKELREAEYDLPILMVTAKDTYPDKKMGFELGADDYMTKPINMDELVLRVKALLRRSKISADKYISIGDIVIDYESLEVRTPTKTMILPKKEFYLLYKLLSYPKKIFTRQELMDDIWGFDSEADERTVDVHIKRIRERFKDIEEFEIVTIRGLGYKGVHK